MSVNTPYVNAPHVNTPHVEDLVSVGSRVSWSAILAGAAVALGLQFLFGTLGATIGGSMSNRVETETLRTSAIVWMIASACVALFAGGVVTTQLTAGENHVEAVIYGIVMWAAVTAIVAHGVAAAGRDTLEAQSSSNWESAARKAGVPADQIQQWTTKIGQDREKTTTTSTTTTQETTMTASNIRWLTFGTAWLSMFSAAAGALVGAGPTFRLEIRSRRPQPSL